LRDHPASIEITGGLRPAVAPHPAWSLGETARDVLGKPSFVGVPGATCAC
jgi:hypothetical protein